MSFLATTIRGGGCRLPVTFYRSLEDLPPFEDQRMEGRTYHYFRGEPLFPFGHGLSYTTFEYGDLRIRPADVVAGGQVAVSLDVANIGERAGDEVVQLYVRHPDASVPRPIKELKGFARLSLQSGERKTVTFALHTHLLSYYDEGMQNAVQPGTVEVMVGSSSSHLPLTGIIEITGTTPVPLKGRVFFCPVEAGYSSVVVR